MKQQTQRAVLNVLIWSLLPCAWGWSEDHSVKSDGVQVVVTGAALQSAAPAERLRVRKAFEDGKPVVFEGTEQNAADWLGIPVMDSAEGNPPEFFIVRRMANGMIARQYHFLARQYVQKIRDGTRAKAPPVSEDPVEVLLTDAEQQTAHDALWPSVLDAASKTSAMAIPVPQSEAARETTGAWDAIQTATWVWNGVSSGIDNGKLVARLTFTANGFKIQDGRADRDWYLVETRPQHEVNIEVDYVQGNPNAIPLVTQYIGWYIQDRFVKTQARGLTPLEEYGPTGTIVSGEAGISIGAGIATDAAGVSASYSRTYPIPDITITDRGSIADRNGDWKEAFTCPRGRYIAGFTDWPANTSKSSFFSWQSAIFRCPDTHLTSGVHLRLTPRALAYKDETRGYYIGQALYVDVTRHLYELGNANRLFDLLHNNPPDPPTVPTGPAEGWVNTEYEFTAEGTDHDGDALSYQYDWGDATTSTYAGTTQSYLWTDGGNYGVRVRTKDSPHGALSEWSPTVDIFIKMLTGLDVSGPDAADEGTTTALYAATASFNTGNPTGVDPQWSVVVGSDYAEIGPDGVLHALSVPQDETITLEASLTDHGVTKTARKSVLIRNVYEGVYLHALADPVDGGRVDVTPLPGTNGRYTEGTSVMLTAVAEGQQEFSHWEGAASGSDNPITVMLDADKTVTAIFARRAGARLWRLYR